MLERVAQHGSQKDCSEGAQNDAQSGAQMVCSLGLIFRIRGSQVLGAWKVGGLKVGTAVCWWAIFTQHGKDCMLLCGTITFSLFGFLIGIWADGFEKLQLIPLLVITPMVFLGGAFYSIDMLPSAWQKVTMFNPVVYLISGFRWSFYEISDVRVGVSLAMIMLFMGICLALIAWIFKTGYRLKQ